MPVLKKPSRGRPPSSAIEARTPEFVSEVILTIPGYDPHRGQAQGYEFDPALAQEAILWLERNIRHCKGRSAGKQFILLDWECAVLANLFGWVRKDTGHLRFRECLIYVAKKNGKSAFAAAIILYMLHGWKAQEYGAEIYGAASTLKQAGHVFNHVVGMMYQNSELSEDLRQFGGHGQNQAKSIYYDDKFSSYFPIAADSNSADGSNVSGAVIDELHRFHTAKHFEFCNVLEMSTAARDQSLILYTTTADFQRESVCNDRRDYALRVRDGIIDDPRFLPVVYELDQADDWEDKSKWIKANPSLGQTHTMDFLEREYEKAKKVSVNRNSFLRLHLNLMTKQDQSWLDMNAWSELKRGYTEEDLLGEECFAGIDLASTRDLTALVLLFPFPDGFKVLSYFWAPRDKAEERSQEDQVPYLTWADQGHIELTPGKYTDYDIVEYRLKELSEKFRITEIAFDPSHAQQLMNNLDHAGFNVYKFQQSFTNYNPVVEELDDVIEKGALAHDNNPVLNFCASNVCLDEQMSTGMKRPSKRLSKLKIDGIVALLMALGRSMTCEKRPSTAYAERGLFT
jgi:phage terminase large subunit-like protein